MCNLYDIGRPRSRSRDDWEEAVSRALADAGDAMKLYGTRKTDPGLAVVLEGGAPEARIMRWGFERPFNPAINNARSDKLGGMWSGSWQEKRRCLVPIRTFYEWSGPTGNKQTFAFESPDGDSRLWAAGLWEPGGESGPAYTILTTGASEAVAGIHDRMPALLRPEQFGEFLGADDPRELLVPFPGELSIFRCENPLKNPAGHAGPVREGFLPGFE